MTASFRRLPPAGLLWAALAVWLVVSSPAGAQGADGTDAPAREAAGKWADDLFRDIRTRQSIHGFAAGRKLALQPLDPLATGLSDSHRWQVYDWMVSALQKADRDYAVVDRARVKEVYRAMEQDGSDSDVVMARYREVLRKQEARINVTCESKSFGGGRIVLDCLATDIETGTNLGSAPARFREDWLPLASLRYALNAVAGEVAAKLGGLEAGRIGAPRIVVDGLPGRKLSDYVARTLNAKILGRVGKYPGWRGVDAGSEGPVYRLEGEFHLMDEKRLEFTATLLRGDTVVPGFGIDEVVALASVPARLLEGTPGPGPGRDGGGGMEVGTSAGEAAAPAELPEIEELDEVRWALKRANLRSGPSAGHDKVGRLDVGAEAAVTGKVAGAPWLRIAVEGGGTAWVHESLLGTGKPESAAPDPKTPAGRSPELTPVNKVMVAKRRTALRRSPDLMAELAGRVESGQKVDVLARMEGWYQIGDDSGLAYASGDSLRDLRCRTVDRMEKVRRVEWDKKLRAIEKSYISRSRCVDRAKREFNEVVSRRRNDCKKQGGVLEKVPKIDQALDIRAYDDVWWCRINFPGRGDSWEAVRSECAVYEDVKTGVDKVCE